MISDKRYKIGIIGCGSIVRNVHLPVLLSLPEVSVRWITDIDQRKSDRLSNDAGLASIAIDEVEAFLSDVDICLLAIPNGPRPGYYRKLHEHGLKGVYVEKPFAKSLREHMEYSAFYRGWQLGIGHDRRAFGLTHLAKSIIKSRIFGDLKEASFAFGSLGRILTGGGYLGNIAMAGGGVLYQMGVHYIDTILFVTPSVDVELDSGVMEAEHGLDIHTRARLAIMTADNKKIPFDITATVLRNTSNKIKLIFDNAIIDFTPAYGDNSIKVMSHNSAVLGYLTSESQGPLTAHTSIASHWQRFLTAVNLEVENETNASQCLLTSKAFGELYKLQDK